MNALLEAIEIAQCFERDKNKIHSHDNTVF